MESFVQTKSAVENDVPVPGILISAIYKSQYGYRVKRTNGTKDFYMMFTLSGQGFIQNAGQTCSCDPGSITLITPGTPHYYGTAEHSVWEFVWCHFIPKPEWASLLQLREAIPGVKKASIDNENLAAKIKKAFARLVEYSLEDHIYAEQLAVSVLEEILLLIARNNYMQKQNLDPRIDETLQYMAQNYNQALGVSVLSKRVNLSESRFSHLFKEQTGESVMKYLSHLRLKHAKKLLETTSLTMAEIAAETGFCNQFYFTRVFKAFSGCTPTEYRERFNTWV